MMAVTKKTPRRKAKSPARPAKPAARKPRDVPAKPARRATKKVARSRTGPDARLDAIVEQAAQNTLAANPLIGVRRKEVLRAATTFVGNLSRRPRAVTAQYANFMGDLARIAVGKSTAAAPDDRRFADPAWTGHAGFRRLRESYLALGKMLDQCVDEAKMDALNTDRARFIVSLFVDAIAPTNFIATNPAALKKLVATKGTSVIRGLANVVDDITSGKGLPRQVDSRPFVVGKNLATTKGAVVFRNDVLELIQYASSTPEVHLRPLLIVPPQINKCYVFDLAPGKSIVQWSLGSGVQTFVASWRNPTKKHADWGFDAYVAALDQAVDAIRAITASPDVNVFGACSGGITLSAFLAYLAAGRERKIHSATVAVCVLDTSGARDTTAGLFVTPATIAAAKVASRKKGVLEGRDLARMFAWMRPNDLIWNYVVNNYLLGNEPPAYDILFWNNDTTRLPAQLHSDFLDLFESNAFAHPGRLRVRGRKVDMSRIGIDTYMVGGVTDHITPWHGVYRTARLYGGAHSTFALSNGGHIQSLINPPGNARSWYMSGAARVATPDGWMKRQKKTEGTWWSDWREWIGARSGPLQPAPTVLGGAGHAPITPAPGTYVFEH